jgi:glycosyltransferase involved in cell wall biosynthesis
MGALVEELLEAGHQVQWLVAPIDAGHPEVGRLKKMGARVEMLPQAGPVFLRWKRLRQRLWSWRTGRTTLRQQVERFGPDRILVNQGGIFCGAIPEFFDLLGEKRGRYSLICHLASPGPVLAGEEKKRADALISGAVKVYFNSRWARKQAEQQLGRVIPQGEFYHLPHRFTFDQPLPWPRGSRPRLALVSRLDADHKGIDLALTALAWLKKEGLDFLFTLHGSGPDEASLRGIVANLGLAKEVSFAGYADNVQKVWKENEILLLPSRREGCAVAMTEAMGFGRPVIATAVGGAPDWIEPGKEGFLCAAPEAELLAETLRSALQERPRWREMGLAAHRKIKERLPARPARLFLESLA